MADASVFAAVAAGAALFAAAGSCASALAAWSALRKNQKTFEAKLLSDLMNEYADERMTNSMGAVEKCFPNPSNEPPPPDRRRVSHYFQKIVRLREKEYIAEEAVRTAIKQGQAEFFLKMEPLERQVHERSTIREPFDERPFKFYAERYNLPRVTK